MKMQTIVNKELASGVIVVIKERTDSKIMSVELQSDSPMSLDLFMGCLLMLVQSHAPDLVNESDNFDCH